MDAYIVDKARISRKRPGMTLRFKYPYLGMTKRGGVLEYPPKLCEYWMMEVEVMMVFQLFAQKLVVIE